MRNQSKIQEWTRRYLPAEGISVILTVVPAMLTYRASGNMVATALAGTWGGNLGYFGTILLRDVWATRRDLHEAGRQYQFGTFLKNVRALVVEFGVAEVIDSFLVRPFLMYVAPRATGDIFWGIIIAKFAADISFYVPAILFYEWGRKQHYRDF